MSPSIEISSFYRFTPLEAEQVEALRRQLESLASESGLRGLILLGREGFNGTVSGSPEAINACKQILSTSTGFDDLKFKDSLADRHPFREFRLKVKSEIVTLGRPDLVPPAPVNKHLSPEAWHAAMNEPGAVVLDARNDYEVDIGKFEGALDFRTKEFHEFPDKLKTAAIPKDQKVLIYCTGGIRCEKAILAMEEQGYENVFQLDGGILNYLQEFPEQKFKGECFVFDFRVAVDQQLQPTSKYSLCPHCGQPANVPVTCVQCKRPETVCSSCHSSGKETCSKNCAHHREIGSKSSKPHLPELNMRHRG